MIVVYSGTRNLYQCMLPSITSLLEHNSPEKVYILIEDDTFPYELPEVCETVNVSALKNRFNPLSPNMSSVFTYMAMIRIMYVDIFPQYDKVIQLDVDTIVCDSLEPLWDIDLSGKWFAACPEWNGNYNPFKHEKYYNIGVCVYNLEQMRKDNCLPFFLRTLDYIRLSCTEQDIMNMYGVPEKVVDIPVRYNESFCCGNTQNPAVVHYAGDPGWWTNEHLLRKWYLDKYKKKLNL